MFVVQMSGFPGTVKSTLDRQISKKIGGVLVDHDSIKFALLHPVK